MGHRISLVILNIRRSGTLTQYWHLYLVIKNELKRRVDNLGGMLIQLGAHVAALAYEDVPDPVSTITPEE